jgi:HK97 family phage major capsid protein
MPFKPTASLLADRPSVDDIRDNLTAAGDYLVSLRTRRDAGDATASDTDDVRATVAFIHDWDPILQAYERGVKPEPRDPAGRPTAATLLTNPESRSLGDLFTTSEQYTNARQSLTTTHVEMDMPGSVFLHSEGFRTLVDETSGQGGLWIPVGQPSDTPPRVQMRRLFLRDLLSKQTTGLTSVPYIQEVNAVSNEGGASAVSEGSAKPEITIGFQQADAPIRKIAAWVPVTEEAMMDAPTLRGYIDTRLAYLLALREEQQLLNGSGTAPQIKGILQQTGLLSQAFSTDVPQTIALAIAQIETADASADAVAMNPTKFWTVMATRYANQLDSFPALGMPFAGPPGTLWGLPVVRSRIFASNKALVGAFQMGGTIFDRMATTIKVGNQHSTYFVENKLVVLAEERVGLAVHRPDYFVDTTVT